MFPSLIKGLPACALALLLPLFFCRVSQGQPAPLGPARWQWARALGYPFSVWQGPEPKVTAMVSDTAARRVYVSFQCTPYVAWRTDEYSTQGVEASPFRFEKTWTGIACFSESGRMEWARAFPGDTNFVDLRGPGGPRLVRRQTSVTSLALDRGTGTLVACVQTDHPRLFLADSSYRFQAGQPERTAGPAQAGLSAKGSVVVAFSALEGRLRWSRQADSGSGTAWTHAVAGPSGSVYVCGTSYEPSASFGGEPGLAGRDPAWAGTSIVALRVSALSGRVSGSRALSTSSGGWPMGVAGFGAGAGDRGLCLWVAFATRMLVAVGDTVETDRSRTPFHAHALVFLDSGLATRSRLMLDRQLSTVSALCATPQGGVLAQIDFSFQAVATANGGQLVFNAPGTDYYATALVECQPVTGAQAAKIRWQKREGISLLHIRYSQWLRWGKLPRWIFNQFQGFVFRLYRLSPDAGISTCRAGLAWQPYLGAGFGYHRPYCHHPLLGLGEKALDRGSAGGHDRASAFRLFRGRLWPLELRYTGGQNFLGLSAPMPGLSPFVSARPRAAGGQGPEPLRLFPNPATASATLHGPAGARAELLDLQGRRLASFRLDRSGKAALEVKGLKAGLYLVRCRQQAARLMIE